MKWWASEAAEEGVIMPKEHKSDFVSGANRPISIQAGPAKTLLVSLAILSVLLLGIMIVKYFGLRSHGMAFDNTNARQPSGWLNPSAAYNGGGRPRPVRRYGFVFPLRQNARR
jgi:hypothetical protein